MLNPDAAKLAAFEPVSVPLDSAHASFRAFAGDIELAVALTPKHPPVRVRGMADLMNLHHSLSDVLTKLAPSY